MTRDDVDWSDWEPFYESPGQPLDEVDRATARRYFNALMSSREKRKTQLERLLSRNGVEIGTDDAGLQRLNDWYRGHVRPDAGDSERLADRWYAVGLDIGVYLGDAIIERAPHLEWRLFTRGRRNASYQRPVVMGFQAVSDTAYNVDPEILVSTHGHQLIAGDEPSPDRFVSIVKAAARQA